MHTCTKAVSIIFKICDYKLHVKAVKELRSGGSASTA